MQRKEKSIILGYVRMAFNSIHQSKQSSSIDCLQHKIKTKIINKAVVCAFVCERPACLGFTRKRNTDVLVCQGLAGLLTIASRHGISVYVGWKFHDKLYVLRLDFFPVPRS